MSARDACLGALRQALARTQPPEDAATVTAVEVVHDVATLQARVFALSQLDALHQIQDALAAIAQLQRGVNQLATLHALPLRRVALVELGMLAKEIDDALWQHQTAQSRLEQGGIPAESRPRAPRAATLESHEQRAA